MANRFTAVIPLEWIKVKIRGRAIPLLKYLRNRNFKPEYLSVLPVAYMKEASDHGVFGFLAHGDVHIALRPSNISNFELIAAFLGELTSDEAVKRIVSDKSKLTYDAKRMHVVVTCFHRPFFRLSNPDAPYMKVKLPSGVGEFRESTENMENPYGASNMHYALTHMPLDVRDLTNVDSLLEWSSDLYPNRPLLSTLDLMDSMRVFRAKWYIEGNYLLLPCLPRIGKTVLKEVDLECVVPEDTQNIEDLMSCMTSEQKEHLFKAVFSNPSAPDVEKEFLKRCAIARGRSQCSLVAGTCQVNGTRATCLLPVAPERIPQ